MCGVSPVSGVEKSRSSQGPEQNSDQQPSEGQTPSTGGTGNTGSTGSTGSTGGGNSKALVDEINRVRAMYGLPPVQQTAELDKSAASNDAANVSSGLGHHNTQNPSYTGEITAMASDGEGAAKAVQEWLNSPEHRAILLDPNMKYVGGSINGNYATADFS